MANRVVLGVSCLLLLGLLAACGDSAPDPAPTPAASATTVATGTATSPPTSTPRPTASATAEATPTVTPVQVASVVQVVEVSTGDVVTLHDSTVDAAFHAAFEGGLVMVRVGADPLYFDLDGTPTTAPPIGPRCERGDGEAIVEGRSYEGVACGSISPDGRWMTYAVDAGEVELESGYVVPLRDQWVVELESGQ